MTIPKGPGVLEMLRLAERKIAEQAARFDSQMQVNWARDGFQVRSGFRPATGAKSEIEREARKGVVIEGTCVEVKD